MVHAAALLMPLLILPAMATISEYNREGEELMEVPHNISENEVIINLNDNKISHTAGRFSHLLILETLTMKENLLTEFPYLCQVSATLQDVILDDNKIRDIYPAYLDCLVSLRYLSLQGNLLTTIPDVTGPGNSLQILYLQRNLFPEVPVLTNMGKMLAIFRIDSNIPLKLFSQQAMDALSTVRLQMDLVEFDGCPNLTQIPDFDRVEGRSISKVIISLAGDQRTPISSISPGKFSARMLSFQLILK